MMGWFGRTVIALGVVIPFAADAHSTPPPPGASMRTLILLG
jgi:hypothetical protein